MNPNFIPLSQSLPSCGEAREGIPPPLLERQSIRLGVVTPLANEELTIDELLARLLAQLSDADRVFCVLDRVSRDLTRRKIEEYSVHDPRVVLVWAPENRHVVDAYFAGYRAAMAAGAQWVLEMDGGLSHRPEEIPQFVSAMARGYDYVGGCRFMPGGGYQGQLSRRIISRGGTLLSNLLLGTRMSDMTGGFECFSRRAMEAVLAHGVHSRGHFFQTEIRLLMHRWNWLELPITYCNPSKSVGMNSLTDAVQNLFRLFRKSARQRRGIITGRSSHE